MKEIILNTIATTVRLDRYANRLPDQEEISNFENALGYVLPDDYREFLLKYNGGVCELKNIIMPISAYLCDLFGLYPDNFDAAFMKLRLPHHPELTELWGQLPLNLLPIGEVDSGDMIAIKFHENKAEIVVIDHEEGDIDILVTANSFTAFLCSTIRE